MLTNPWLTSLSAFEFAAVIVTLCLLVRAKLTSRWPSLAAALALEAITDVALTWLLFKNHHYAPYFYVYWFSAGLQSLLKLWIIGDAMRSFPGLGFLPRPVYLSILTFSGTVAATCASYVFHAHPNRSAGIFETMLLLERTADFAWVAFAVGCLICVKVLGFAWSEVGARITTAVILRMLSRAIVAEMLTQHSERFTFAATVFDSLSTIAILLGLSFCFAAWSGGPPFAMNLALAGVRKVTRSEI